MKEYVVLVNRSGKRTGVAEKMDAHKKGLLHRAFSVFIFNAKGEMLLQRRAYSKYHFAGMWSNTCCSHPKPGERVKAAAIRRLHEELGIITPINLMGHTIYSFSDSNTGLIEHEYDYVLKGDYEGKISINKNEVSETRWINPQALKREIKSFPHLFTPWFKKIIDSESFNDFILK